MGKYGPIGGFTPQRLGKKLPGGMEEILCQAANGSLASATWRKYESCWRVVEKLVKDRGESISFPLSQEGLWFVMGVLVESGKKPCTIEGYMASLKQAHKIRGHNTAIFDDPFIKAVGKGLKNRVSLEPKKERVSITMDTMRKWRCNVRVMRASYVDRRMIWTALSWIFCGSLRPSEILANEDRSGEGVGFKALRWKSVKLMDHKQEGKREEVVQINLTAPKTMRTMPYQVVALPAVSSVLCPVAAWKAFRKAKGKVLNQDDLVFSWSSGNPFTIRELGGMMGEWSGQGPRATPRDLRAALPTLLARKGVSEDTLKMLGRWSSQAYNSYIRQGRANAWSEAKAAIQLALN